VTHFCARPVLKTKFFGDLLFCFQRLPDASSTLEIGHEWSEQLRAAPTLASLAARRFAAWPGLPSPRARCARSGWTTRPSASRGSVQITITLLISVTNTSLRRELGVRVLCNHQNANVARDEISDHASACIVEDRDVAALVKQIGPRDANEIIRRAITRSSRAGHVMHLVHEHTKPLSVVQVAETEVINSSCAAEKQSSRSVAAVALLVVIHDHTDTAGCIS